MWQQDALPQRLVRHFEQVTVRLDIKGSTEYNMTQIPADVKHPNTARPGGPVVQVDALMNLWQWAKEGWSFSNVALTGITQLNDEHKAEIEKLKMWRDRLLDQIQRRAGGEQE